jgi:hypothetical protein
MALSADGTIPYVMSSDDMRQAWLTKESLYTYHTVPMVSLPSLMLHVTLHIFLMVSDLSVIGNDNSCLASIRLSPYLFIT